MNLMQISFAVLSFGMILGFLAVVFSILFQAMEHKREVSARTAYFQKVAKVRAVGVVALYSSAVFVLLGLVMLAISIKGTL